MEHRWGDRRQVILSIRLYGSDRSAAIGLLTDISLSGAYVRTAFTPADLSQINIEVDEHDRGNTGPGPLQLQGRVVRHGPTGVGIEWKEFASASLGELVRIATCIHSADNQGSRTAAPSKLPARACHPGIRHHPDG
jgi:hypothetical protein